MYAKLLIFRLKLARNIVEALDGTNLIQNIICKAIGKLIPTK